MTKAQTPWEPQTDPEGFRFLEVRSQRLIWVDSSRLEDCLAYYQSHQLIGVAIAPMTDFRLDRLDVLQRFQGLQMLVVLDSESVDTSAVCSMVGLKYLQFSGRPKRILDLTGLMSLNELRCDWWPGLIFPQFDTLRVLALSKYKNNELDLTGLPPASRLTDLELVQSRVRSLAGIERFGSLGRFGAYYLPALSSIAPLAAMERLEVLEIENCPKISDYEALSEIKSLRVLRLNQCGQIGSLSFLEGLPALEEFRFVGTVVADGDLRPCLRLKRVGFEDKRHYSHRYSHWNEACS